MVVGAFPAAKLGALLLKQISKPIANVIKDQAKSSPVFRQYVCMPPAQFYNWCEVKAKMWILNLGKPVNIPVLNEAMAIELGANILGEGIIFTIAAIIVIGEYSRSSKKEAAKEEAKKQELSEIHNAITELFIQSEEQGAQLRELMRKLGDLDTRIGGTNGSKSPAESPPKSPTNVDPPEKQPARTPSSSHTPSSGYYPNYTPPSGQPPVHIPAPLKDNLNLTQHTVHYPDPTSYKRSNSVHKSLILRAVDDVENQFWNSPLVERQNGIVILAVYHIYKLFRFQE